MEEFAAYVQNRAGETLRVIAWYEDRRSGIAYQRDDLNPELISRRVEVTHERLTLNRRLGDDPALDELGPTRASVHIWDEIVVLHFPLDERRGVLVSLEAGVARDLHEFVHECLQRLPGGFTTRGSKRRPAE